MSLMPDYMLALAGHLAAGESSTGKRTTAATFLQASFAMCAQAGRGALN